MKLPSLSVTVPFFSVLMGADWALSEWAVTTGVAVELNPLPWAVPAYMGVVKIAGLVLTLALLHMMRWHWPTLARSTMLGACGVMCLVIVNNLEVILSQ